MIEQQHIQFVVYPGLGEDHRMGYTFEALPYRVIRPDYIEPLPKESMASYARRLSDDLMRSSKLDLSKPIFLAGVSMGGTVIQEMSRFLRVNGLILVSAYHSNKELGFPLVFLGKYLSQILPLFVFHGLGYLAPFLLRFFLKIPVKDLLLCTRMYLDFPKRWFRDQCYMDTAWEGCEITTPFLRIHGKNDLVVPVRDQSDIDVLIPNDRHMCNFSHRELVNKEIQAFVRRILHQS